MAISETRVVLVNRPSYGCLSDFFVQPISQWRPVQRVWRSAVVGLRRSWTTGERFANNWMSRQNATTRLTRTAELREQDGARYQLMHRSNTHTHTHTHTAGHVVLPAIYHDHYKIFYTSGYATWFTAGGAIRIAHYDVIDDVITRKL